MWFLLDSTRWAGATWKQEIIASKTRTKSTVICNLLCTFFKTFSSLSPGGRFVDVDFFVHLFVLHSLHFGKKSKLLYRLQCLSTSLTEFNMCDSRRSWKHNDNMTSPLSGQSASRDYIRDYGTYCMLLSVLVACFLVTMRQEYLKSISLLYITLPCD